MSMYEVWEYGEGDGPRMQYHTVSEQKAMKAHMDRVLFTGKTYREHLWDDGIDRLLLCVKNPALKGTRHAPNYPSVYTLNILGKYVKSSLHGYLIDGEVHQSPV